ncbi:hypothetical protein [uncultured Fibrobacter sp.]|uniref:hypothetical protein n=1 Tax=uncultured Fibrobacter sp. TaxID=261512 RepID=UPI0025E70A57|nr:hypothetical protein [uncultured Fibrobacter sp.]
MLRQFDVIVVSKRFADGAKPTPPFTDPSLGWFFVDDINKGFEASEAEWIVVASEQVKVTREFLNNLAECNASFPMVDALAPRIHCLKDNTFHSGFRLDPHNGMCMLDENAKMRFVAAPHPLIGAYSRRIVQRTGKVDASLSYRAQVVDFTLRMLHAGGKMFSVPYLVANTSEAVDDTLFDNSKSLDEFTFAMFKSLGLWTNRKFLMRHAGTLYGLWKRRKELEEKRDKAILLSKLDKKFLEELG